MLSNGQHLFLELVRLRCPCRRDQIRHARPFRQPKWRWVSLPIIWPMFRPTGSRRLEASFTAVAPVSYGLGAAPNGRSGGTNPIQVGTGVQLAGISTDFRQGSLRLSADPLDMAIEGDGFFILQGSGGEQLFSRNGDFHVNADGEIVSAAGDRLLGFPVDANFQLNRSELAPLKLPAGMLTPDASLVGISADHDGRLSRAFHGRGDSRPGTSRPVRFANPSGLEGRSENMFATGSNSGLPVVADPSVAQIEAGVLESSNTSIDHELMDLSLTSLMFRTNLQVFRATDSMLDELMNLRRA